MSRTITENGNRVWIYKPGQEDPQAFIYLIHEIGSYSLLDFDKDGKLKEYNASEYFFDLEKKAADAYQDILTLTREDDFLPLKNLFNKNKSIWEKELEIFNNKFKDTPKYVSSEQQAEDIEFINENCPNLFFYSMVNNFIQYMYKNPKEEYHFVGDM